MHIYYYNIIYIIIILYKSIEDFSLYMYTIYKQSIKKKTNKF